MKNLNLGAFCMSLTVKDIHASKEFYEKLGFVETGGNIDHNWIVLRNEDKVIGLFQGMFEKNMLTFNPGWDQQAQPTEEFTDVREIAEQLIASGLELNEKPVGESGPAYITLTDPDGNPVLIDQHR
ncbi:MAG: VOC family protein [Pedobacter sp.]|nr:MAG: VOC family protein [Pedobacter sp.]